MNKLKNDKYFSFDELNKFNNIIHFYTKRPFDFNKNTVSIDQIKCNYKMVSDDFNYNFNKIINCVQNHTNIVKVIDSNNLDDDFVNVDGLITNLKNVALVTYLADCQAILLYDPIKKVIGNIHSGWKGTLNKIIENAIKIMINDFSCNSNDIIACICPSILNCCFEVDEDVMLMFKETFSDYNSYISLGDLDNDKQKYYIDTVSINVDIMKNLGIHDNNIIFSNVCTKCNSDVYHSYRKDKDKSGRNIALICLKDDD